jgi:predicted Zn-dependent protease
MTRPRRLRDLRLACLSLALLLALGLASACVTSPTGRSQLIFVSDAQMNELGVASFQQLKGEKKISQDPAINAYVTCVARAVTGALSPSEYQGSWEVVVFQDDSANAFALPGGKIGVFTGLLSVAKNQDQLATVLGHEVAHVIARHSAERVSQGTAAQLLASGVAATGVVNPASASGQLTLAALGLGMEYGVLKPYGRAQESEADRIGLDYMARAGFDPAQSIELWKNMAASGGANPPEFLSTHPSHATRIADLQRRLPEARKLQQQARAAGRRPTCHR